MQIEVPGEVRPRDPTDGDREIVVGIRDERAQLPGQLVDGLLVEGALEVGQAEQHAHVGGDVAVVQPHASNDRAPEAARPQRPQVRLEAGGPQTVVGELRKDALSG